MNFAQNDVSRPPRRKGHETIKRLEKTPGKVSAYTGTNPKTAHPLAQIQQFRPPGAGPSESERRGGVAGSEGGPPQRRI